MTLYKQLKTVELDFNTYQIDLETAIQRATPLLNEYNRKCIEIAKKYKVQPQLLNISHFAFGRQ